MADVGTGITISFATSGFSAELTDIQSPEAQRGALETTHQGTTVACTFTPQDLVDWGSLEITGHGDPATDPPIDEPAETLTITWPDGDIWSFDGFMTNYRLSAPLNDLMSFSATVKVSGDVTVA